MSKLFADLLDKQSSPSPPPAAAETPQTEAESKPVVTSPRAALDATPRRLPPRQSKAARQPTKSAIPNPTNIAILHLTAEEIDDLRSTAYKNQTFRFSEDELNWLRDRSYGLSRALDRKVGQNDLLRFALKILRKSVADSPEILEELLRPII